MFHSFYTALLVMRDIDHLNRFGYLVIDDFVEEDVAVRMLADAERHKPSLNVNRIQGVSVDGVYLHSHFAAISRDFFQLLLADRIQDLCATYFASDDFYLRSQRYYESYPCSPQGGFSNWHVDNKRFGPNGVLNNRGLVFLLYLNSVNGLETELIKGSHRRDIQTDTKRFFDDQAIIDSYPEDKITLATKKRRLVVYDSRVIHRATKSRSKGNCRKTVFFQIDECPRSLNGSSGHIAEPVILNSEFLEDFALKQIAFFSPGKKSDFPVPKSDVSLMQPENWQGTDLLRGIWYLNKNRLRKSLVEIKGKFKCLS